MIIDRQFVDITKTFKLLGELSMPVERPIAPEVGHNFAVAPEKMSYY